MKLKLLYEVINLPHRAYAKQVQTIYDFYGLYSAMLPNVKKQYLQSFIKEIAPVFIVDIIQSIFLWEQIEDSSFDEKSDITQLRKTLNKLKYYVLNHDNDGKLIDKQIDRMCNANIKYSQLFWIAYSILEGNIIAFDNLVDLAHQTGTVIAFDCKEFEDAVNFKASHDNPVDYLDKVSPEIKDTMIFIMKKYPSIDQPFLTA